MSEQVVETGGKRGTDGGSAEEFVIDLAAWEKGNGQKMESSLSLLPVLVVFAVELPSSCANHRLVSERFHRSD